MPTARELLEQADALMRRNRPDAFDDIPILTDAVPVTAPAVDPGDSAIEALADDDDFEESVPVLTESVDAPLFAGGTGALEGEPSDWLEFEDPDPSVIGDAPDSIAIVPPVDLRRPVDDELLESAEHEEIELTTPLEDDFDDDFRTAPRKTQPPALENAPHASQIEALDRAELADATALRAEVPTPSTPSGESDAALANLVAERQTDRSMPKVDTSAGATSPGSVVAPPPYFAIDLDDDTDAASSYDADGLDDLEIGAIAPGLGDEVSPVDLSYRGRQPAHESGHVPIVRNDDAGRDDELAAGVTPRGEDISTYYVQRTRENLYRGTHDRSPRSDASSAAAPEREPDGAPTPATEIPITFTRLAQAGNADLAMHVRATATAPASMSVQPVERPSSIPHDAAGDAKALSPSPSWMEDRERDAPSPLIAAAVPGPAQTSWDTPAASLTSAAPLAAMPPLPAAPPAPTSAQIATAAAADKAHWESVAEEIRMQVLQRIDLFTDTGLREQLGAHLKPIVDRASADLVATINLRVGELLRAYVAEAIEREIERWRRDN